MADARSPLDAVTIASPCTVPWNSMKGDDRKRYCGSCCLHVYDVSQMSRPEAESLLLHSEGRVCARLWRRTDGTLLTKDCGPIRLAIERRLRWVRVAAAAILGAMGLGGCTSNETGVVRPTSGAIAPPQPPPTMGKPAMPPPPPSNPPPATPKAP